jgi:hypothetical protein
LDGKLFGRSIESGANVRHAVEFDSNYDAFCWWDQIMCGGAVARSSARRHTVRNISCFSEEHLYTTDSASTQDAV